MTARRLRGEVRRSIRTLLVAVGAVVPTAALRGDEVTLISGATVRQAIGGRVRGQVQSESPTEVVVLLGANTTRVPTDQIASIRYDGQTATFQLAESRASTGQLAEAADLFKKAAGETAGRPYPQQTALFREAEALGELALVEPERAKQAQDKLTGFLRSYPASRHLAAAREALARLQLATEDFSGAEAT